MKKAKKGKYISLIAFTLLMLFSLPFSTFINSLINKTLDKTKIVSKNDQLLIHFINVGEADAMAINFPNGEIAIIDTGRSESIYQFLSYVDDNVINSKRDKIIDYLFFTHCDTDHIGGLTSVLARYDVKNVYRPRQFSDIEEVSDIYGYVTSGEEYRKCITDITNEGCNFTIVTDNMVINIGEVELKIFSPYKKYTSSNEYSYLIKLTYRNKSVLFTGDASEKVEADIMAMHYMELDSDILKVAHHGANDSTSIDFLQCVSPEYAVISVGSNLYGHPTEAVLNKLSTCGVTVFRTDNDGNILLKLTNNIEFLTDYYSFTPLEITWTKVCVLIILIELLIVLLDIVKFVIKYIKKKKLQSNG